MVGHQLPGGLHPYALNVACEPVDRSGMGLSLWRREKERVIYLDEDVYVVIGDPARGATQLPAWPAAGSYGPAPEGAIVGHLVEVLDWLGPELWSAKRRGTEVCLGRPLASFTATTGLEWGADCVEHLARRVSAIDGNVVETLKLARGYAREHRYDQQNAERLAAEAEEILHRLRKGGAVAFGKGVASRALDLEGGLLGVAFGPTETRYEAGQFATADLRAMQVAVMHATKELCHADPLLAGREAARWCRRASARNALAQEAGDRANAAQEAGWFNLLLNPFAQGTLARSVPGQVKAMLDGDLPEAEWQASRLLEYLQRTDDEPLGSAAPW
jgi:NAD(P)H-dependent FMN reductase